MPHQERNTLLSAATNLLVNGYVIWRIVGHYGSGALDGPEGPQVLARMLIWVIALSIVLTIALTIGLSICYAVLTGRHDGDLITDERDRLFENRGMAATMLFAALGFILAFAALAWGVRPVTVFVMLYFSFAIGSLAGDLVRLASYRAGG